VPALSPFLILAPCPLFGLSILGARDCEQRDVRQASSPRSLKISIDFQVLQPKEKKRSKPKQGKEGQNADLSSLSREIGQVGSAGQATGRYPCGVVMSDGEGRLTVDECALHGDCQGGITFWGRWRRSRRRGTNARRGKKRSKGTICPDGATCLARKAGVVYQREHHVGMIAR
jgi:hypothetical protein